MTNLFYLTISHSWPPLKQILNLSILFWGDGLQYRCTMSAMLFFSEGSEHSDYIRMGFFFFTAFHPYSKQQQCFQWKSFDKPTVHCPAPNSTQGRTPSTVFFSRHCHDVKGMNALYASKRYPTCIFFTSISFWFSIGLWSLPNWLRPTTVLCLNAPHVFTQGALKQLLLRLLCRRRVRDKIVNSGPLGR